MPATRSRLWIAVLLGLCAAAAAAPPALAPFKDALFGYPPLTAIGDGGDSIDVDYREARDIDARDAVPERRVRPDYVDLAPLRTQKSLTVATPAGPLGVMMAGEAGDPAVITLFIHGRGGDRRLGMNDYTFGGNFNRLKNLMARNRGLYVTADAGTFSTSDADRIVGLIETLGTRHPAAKLVLACGSMGGGLCWEIAGRPAVMGRVAGLILLSASSDMERFARMRAAAGGRAVPLILGHGTRDKVFPWDGARAVYTGVRAGAKGYPIRFVSFESGNHGTPIRMIDWRDSLNWILARAG